MPATILDMQTLTAYSPELGNKVKNLAVLEQARVRVPRGFGLSYDAYSAHVEPLLSAMDQALRQATDYPELARKLHEIIVSKPLAQAKEVQAALKQHMSGAPYFAVRSSGAPVVDGEEIAEDSASVSLAGQYESFLLVPAFNVPNAILWCFASLFSERCLRQFKVLEGGEAYLGSRMSVLVQEMHIADFSAVVMTRDPVEGGDNFGIEFTHGPCEAIVSGEVHGDFYLLSRESGAILQQELGTKKTRVVYEPLIDLEVPNKRSQALPPELSAQYAGSDKLIQQIYELGMFIERHFGAPQDIELVVVGGEIIVTQTRPITAGK